MSQRSRSARFGSPTGSDAFSLARFITNIRHNMLNGLDAIDWSSFEDAYGNAGETPHRLRALLSDDEEVRREALGELFGSVWHQGTIYSVSARVIPFLVELIGAPQVKEKEPIVVLLASIAGGRGYYEVHEPLGQKLMQFPFDINTKRNAETRAVDAVRRAASSHIPELLQHLESSNESVRTAIARALPFYPEHSALAKSALERALDSETDPDVREMLTESLRALVIQN